MSDIPDLLAALQRSVAAAKEAREADVQKDDDEPEECGYVYDHDTETVYEGEDGLQWVCRRCGAEGFEEPETAPADSEPTS